jgi:hypothetical protein
LTRLPQAHKIDAGSCICRPGVFIFEDHDLFHNEEAIMTRFVWLSALAFAAVAFSQSARAEILSISATGLVLRCPCTGGGEDIAEENKGLLVAQKPNGRYFVPVVFPKTAGQRVCRVSMIYQDKNAADAITARLYGKSYSVGGNPLAGRHPMATLTSAAGTVNTVRVATTTAITAPVIRRKWFYYLEVDLPTFNLNVIGFQIEYKPAC